MGNFCTKCGKPLADGEVCNCQAPQIDPAQQAAPQQQSAAPQQYQQAPQQQYQQAPQRSISRHHSSSISRYHHSNISSSISRWYHSSRPHLTISSNFLTQHLMSGKTCHSRQRVRYVWKVHACDRISFGPGCTCSDPWNGI